MTFNSFHMKPADFETIVLCAREGMREARGMLFEMCYSRLLEQAKRLVPRDLRAKFSPEDSVQDSLMEAFRDFHQFHGTSDKDLLRWLGRILRNNVRNAARDFRGSGKREVSREVALDDPNARENVEEALVAPTPGPEADAMRREEVAAIQRAVTQLPDPYRQVIFLRDYQSRPFEEICQRMHLPSADAARKLHERAVDHLRPIVCAPNQPSPLGGDPDPDDGLVGPAGMPAFLVRLIEDLRFHREADILDRLGLTHSMESPSRKLSPEDKDALRYHEAAGDVIASYVLLIERMWAKHLLDALRYYGFPVGPAPSTDGSRPEGLPGPHLQPDLVPGGSRGQAATPLQPALSSDDPGGREPSEEARLAREASPGEEEASCQDEALALFHALERLPWEQWTVIWIHWSGCFAFEEIALLFGWALPAAANEHYGGAIAWLCQELGSATPVPPSYRSWIAYLFGCGPRYAQRPASPKDEARSDEAFQALQQPEAKGRSTGSALGEPPTPSARQVLVAVGAG